jgi:hypothetical protein
MHGLEDAQIPVELITGRVVANRPTGLDLNRTRSDSAHGAIRGTEEVDEVLDQIGVVEMHRCHCRRPSPGVPHPALHFSVSSPSRLRQLHESRGRRASLKRVRSGLARSANQRSPSSAAGTRSAALGKCPDLPIGRSCGFARETPQSSRTWPLTSWGRATSFELALSVIASKSAIPALRLPSRNAARSRCISARVGRRIPAAGSS